MPRPAATVLVLRDDPFEVLMVRRHGNGPFASALVFPGGLVDPADREGTWLPLLTGADGIDPEDRALGVAAFRETFEETALLLARDDAGRAVACPGESDGDFRATVAASGGKLPLGELVRFGHWITPESAPKRFDTHFFLPVRPKVSKPCAMAAKRCRLEWVSPPAVLDRAAGGDQSILFPTRMNLKRLAESDDDVASAMAAARARPRFTVTPVTERREGGIAVVIPAEAGYSETKNFHPHPPRAG